MTLVVLSRYKGCTADGIPQPASSRGSRLASLIRRILRDFALYVNVEVDGVWVQLEEIPAVLAERSECAPGLKCKAYTPTCLAGRSCCTS
eukprot:112754-Amphidinium_carterae.2